MAFVTKDWKDAPDTTTPLSATALEDLETRLAAYADARISYQTSLPGSPADGDTIAYGADPSNGVIWHLRYRSGGGTYKWEFIGGSALSAEVATGEAITSTTFIAPPTNPGPTITLPLAGVYDIRLDLGSYQVTGGVGYGSYAIGGTAAVDTDAIVTGLTASSTYQSRGRRKTIASASTAISFRCRTSANTLQLTDRALTIVPVMVG